MVSACTIIARNYLAHARVLAESFFAHHPDGRFTVLLIDDEKRELDASREAFGCLRLSDIGLARAEIGQLAAIYDVTELATAVKPPLLRHLLGTGPSDLIYLDPDIKIYGSLEEVSRLARRHSIVLTPHTTASAPRDGRKISDFQILAAGVYNLGFVAVGPGSEAFLAWWWQKTRREAHSDPLRMMFTDQRWVDFVPGFFNHLILKEPAYNVAYWNLHARDLTWNGSGYMVDGEPLKFFHFSGFDARKPYLLSKHQGEHPRILLSERPALARICREYRESLEQAGLSRASVPSYGWSTLASGLPYDRRMRRLYREELEAFENGRGPEPPSPLDGGLEASTDDRFLSWLNEPVAIGLRASMSRYLHAVYQDRVDVQKAFPDLVGGDLVRYLEWARTFGAVEEKIPAELCPPQFPRDGSQDLTYVPSTRATRGVNIAGYFRGEVGVGEAARLLTSAVEAAGIPHSTLAYDATESRNTHPFVERGDGRAPHDINVVCVNADQIARFATDAGQRFFAGRYTVGYWFWELDQFPLSMHRAFDYVDEVWTATDFVASGIRAAGRRPVHTIPPAVPIPRGSPDVTRSTLGLPPGFMFLFMFDFFSVLERKNPTGLVDAFKRAFPSPRGPILVIKTINGHLRLNHLEKVRAAAADRPDILIIGLCDCYVSLHRSEGLGLTMAEAMGIEKPVIATGYSGNLDFMTPDNSYLVDYAIGEVPAECEPYPKGSAWAEPDLDQAAEYMARVYRAREEAAQKARRARRDILTKHNVDRAAVVLKRRLKDIRRTRGRAALSGLPAASRASTSGAPASDRGEAARPGDLDHIVPLLTPTASVAPGRRFGWPLRMVQRLLFRILRPYWWQQRQIQTLLLEKLNEVAQATAKLGNAERHQQDALESLWSAVGALERLEKEKEENESALHGRP
jgi:glycosyltransferase involved in cell wall biosynthesis